MLQRNLLYTGVTRGKRLVVLVGQKKAVAIAVRNVSGRRRWSKLAEWLSADVSKRSVSVRHPCHDCGRGSIWRAGKYGTSQLRRFEHASGMSAIPPIVLQKSANERSAPENGQYQNPKVRFLESKFSIRDLI
jgi:hypothetical protein